MYSLDHYTWHVVGTQWILTKIIIIVCPVASGAPISSKKLNCHV